MQSQRNETSLFPRADSNKFCTTIPTHRLCTQTRLNSVCRVCGYYSVCRIRGILNLFQRTDLGNSTFIRLAGEEQQPPARSCAAIKQSSRSHPHCSSAALFSLVYIHAYKHVAMPCSSSTLLKFRGIYTQNDSHRLCTQNFRLRWRRLDRRQCHCLHGLARHQLFLQSLDLRDELGLILARQAPSFMAAIISTVPF